MYEYWREHLFRKTYGHSHQQYLDEPADAVAWMLAMIRVDDELDMERQRRQNEANQHANPFGR